MTRIRLTILLIAATCLSLTAFLFANPSSALAASHSIQSTTTSHVAGQTIEHYDTAKVLAMPGAQVVKVTKVFSLTLKTTSNHAGTPTYFSTYHYLYVRATIAWVFLFGHFLCGYGIGEAWTNPWWAFVNEQGDLYVNGNWKDGTISDNISYTSDETGCWNFGHNTFWEMFVSGAARWFDGRVAYAEVAVFGFQP